MQKFMYYHTIIHSKIIFGSSEYKNLDGIIPDEARSTSISNGIRKLISQSKAYWIFGPKMSIQNPDQKAVPKFRTRIPYKESNTPYFVKPASKYH